MDNFEEVKEKVMKDKTWLGIIVLIFIMPTFGIIALVVKILYTFAIADMNKESSADTPENTGYYRSTTFGEMEIDDVERMDNVSKIEEDLIFDEVMEMDVPVYNEPVTEEISMTDYLQTKHLEEAITNSTNALKIDEQESVIGDIETTMTDVHMEDVLMTSVSQTGEHDHQKDKPLKTITCTMCGTINDIYKIDIFETPSCQKCGMLLLDRS